MEAVGVEIGRRIKRRREKKHWGQERLAVELGVSARSVVRWEKGQNLPAAKSIAKLVEHLGGRARDYTAAA